MHPDCPLHVPFPVFYFNFLSPFYNAKDALRTLSWCVHHVHGMSGFTTTGDIRYPSRGCGLRLPQTPARLSVFAGDRSRHPCRDSGSCSCSVSSHTARSTIRSELSLRGIQRNGDTRTPPISPAPGGPHLALSRDFFQRRPLPSSSLGAAPSSYTPSLSCPCGSLHVPNPHVIILPLSLLQTTDLSIPPPLSRPIPLELEDSEPALTAVQ